MAGHREIVWGPSSRIVHLARTKARTACWPETWGSFSAMRRGLNRFNRRLLKMFGLGAALFTSAEGNQLGG
jgi:hypothetical protein